MFTYLLMCWDNIWKGIQEKNVLNILNYIEEVRFIIWVLHKIDNIDKI